MLTQIPLMWVLRTLFVFLPCALSLKCWYTNPVLFKFLPEEQPCFDDQDACLIADTVTLFSGLTVKFTQKECGYNDSCYSATEIPTDTFPFTTVKCFYGDLSNHAATTKESWKNIYLMVLTVVLLKNIG